MEKTLHGDDRDAGGRATPAVYVWIRASKGSAVAPGALAQVHARAGSASSAIRLDPTYAYLGGDIGYDGQFYAIIALDPGHAAAYLDTPAGRMGHIVYPLVVRLLAMGQLALISGR